MTIATTTNTVTASGNGSTTVFPFTFYIPNAASVIVTYTDALGVATQLLPSQFSITGIGSASGGNVTYPLAGPPIAAGTKLTITRTVPYTQPTSLVAQGGYYPGAVEAALDNLEMQIQQLAASVTAGVAGVSSFNSRTGAISLASVDVTSALGFTPLAPANNLSDLANVTSARANLGLGTMAVETAVLYAKLASPAFTGTPTAPTAALGTSTTQIATTAFVIANAASAGVASFNARTGAITLTIADVTGALTYTPLNVAQNLADVAAPATALANLGGAALIGATFTGTVNAQAVLPSYVAISGTTGPKGPIYITRNPASTAAGEALGLRINISSTDNNSPGANDYVGIEDRVTNDGRAQANLWAANFVTQQGNGVTGNVQARVLEVELSGDTSAGTLQTDPFSGLNLRLCGIEVNAIAGTSTLTAGYTLWSNNTGPTGWWGIGMALSKVKDVAFQLRKFPGDGADPFATAVFDLSTLTLNPQTFVLGHSGADTDLSFKNGVDFAMGLSLDSGTSVSQVSRLKFLDRGTTKWRIEKDASNNLAICDVVAGTVAGTWKTGGLLGIGIVPTYRLDVVGAAGSGVPAAVFRPDNNAGINVVIQRSADGSGSASIGTITNHTVRIMANGTDYWRVDPSGNVVPGNAALATNATNGFTYIETCAGTPTGVPATYTGRAAMVYDSANNKFYIYNGAWKGVTLA